MKVVIAGAAGKMGRAMCAGLIKEEDMQIAAAIDVTCVGQDIGELAGCGPIGVKVESDIKAALLDAEADALLEFTSPATVYANTRFALEAGLPVVVGATGLTQEQLTELDSLARARGLSLFVAANFAIGAVLMMRFAAEAARYLPEYEVLEIHNERKADAPSGTARYTLDLMEEQRREESVGAANTAETIIGSRGGAHAGSRVHSMRLPGVVAIQEVMFGALGQTLTLRHESISRDSFFPGVALALRSITSLPPGLTSGLDKLLEK